LKVIVFWRSCAEAKLPEMLGITVTFVIFLFAIIEYRTSVAQSRSEASLQYILMFQSAPISDYRRDIDQVWINYDLRDLTEASNASEVANELSRRIIRGEDGEAFVESFVGLVSFIDAAAACASSNVCSDALLRREMASVSRNLKCLHGFVISSVRAQQHREWFGDGLTHFAPETC